MKKYNLYIWLGLCLFFSVEAKAQCTLNLGSLGNIKYDVFDNTDQINLINGQVSCTEETFVQIQVSTGTSGTYTNRKMINGAHYVLYNLYTGTNQSSVWGDGTNNSSVWSGLILQNKSTQIVGNLVIEAYQNPLSGVYMDTLIYTIVY